MLNVSKRPIYCDIPTVMLTAEENGRELPQCGTLEGSEHPDS